MYTYQRGEFPVSECFDGLRALMARKPTPIEDQVPRESRRYEYSGTESTQA
jgi:hypothetical protein